MRLHANDPTPLVLRAIIIFNGKITDPKLTPVVMADEEEGEIWHYRRDRDGNYQHRDGELQLFVQHGKVKIIDPDNVDLASFYLK